MSGYGVVSTRIGRSWLKELQASSARHGTTVHEKARASVEKADHLDVPQLLRLPDPPWQADRVRFTFYLGRESKSGLNLVARRAGLAPSVLLLRLLKARPEVRKIKPVQRVVAQKETQRSSSKSSLILGALFLLPLITAVLGFPIPVDVQANSTRPFHE